jgi:hypothetical protein
MKTKNTISPVLMIMAICLHCWAGPIFAEEKSSAVRCANGKLSIQAQNIPLGRIVEELKDKCRVNVFGLDGRSKEPISFTASEEMPENALKRLLRQLDEDNYALEYSRAGLNRVSVVPKSTAKNTSPPASSLPFPFAPPPQPEQQPPPVVSVIDIIPGSQGESAGLQKGDVVIDYDGAKISDSQQLIQEVKSKESKPTVEVTVLRNNTPMTFVLKGGFIGVNIANSNPK